MLESYAADFRGKSLTDDKAKKLIEEAVAIEQAEGNLKGDAPVFLDVASVINQYLVEGAVGFSGNLAQNPQLPWPYTALYNWLGSGRYAERPTITYSPIGGEKFARSLMTPIPPAAILNFLQGGYPVDVVLRLAVHSINGIRSRYGAGARMREADPAVGGKFAQHPAIGRNWYAGAKNR